jgi:energy-coupling factor transport system permease protein
LRFLPLVQEEFQNLLRSIATRSVNLRRLGWQASLGLVLALGERLLANVLLRAEQGAESLLARGGRWITPAQLQRNGVPAKGLQLLGGLGLVLMLGLRWKYGAF